MTIKQLVFNGGGARGVGMPGVYYALKQPYHEDQSSIFDEIETIAGTSVGSLTACLFSVGPTTSEFKDFMSKQNLLKILGIDKLVFPFFISLEPLKNFIDQYFRDKIYEYIQNNMDQCNTDSHLLQLYKNVQNQGYAITFQDLDHLHRIFPKKFKNIVITSTVSDNGLAKLVLHDVHKTPTSSISSACLASCAIYPIFKPIKIVDKFHYDGGCSEPLPSESFNKGNPSERLLFVFGPGPCFMGKIWEKTLFESNPKLILQTINKFNTLEKPDQNEIFIYIDKKNKKVHYRTSQYQSSIDFSLLGISCYDCKEMNNNDEFEKSIPKESQIFIYIDKETQKVHYKSSQFKSFIDQASFNIDMVQDLIALKSCEASFFTCLAKRGHADSILGRFSPFWILDYFAFFIEIIYGFKIYIATLFESLCQRLRTYYSSNTVVLNSVLQGNSFQYAETIQQPMEALYFLVTMTHLIDKLGLITSSFYSDIINKYSFIENLYNRELYNDSKQRSLFPKHDSINNCSAQNPLCQAEQCSAIIKYATQKPESACAFVLTLAVQLHLGHLNKDSVGEQIKKRVDKEKSSYFNFFKNFQFQQQTKGISKENLTAVGVNTLS